MLKQPVTSDNGQTIERKAHGFAHAHEAIDGSHFGQHMGRVGALTLAFLEPALFFEHGQHGIQQQLFGLPFKQTLAKVRQDGKVKAGIGQL